MYYGTRYFSPIGELFLAGDLAHIIGLWFPIQVCRQNVVPHDIVMQDIPVLQAAKAWLDDYFAERRPTPSRLPLAPEGTVYQQQVWQVLCEIPYGKTITYAEVAAAAAKKMGRPTASARAAGSAIGKNPISIIIPCHRVIGADGSLTGYAGGIENKVKLLRHERAEGFTAEV